MTIAAMLTALLSALVLSACGGSDDGDCCGGFLVSLSVDGQLVSQGPVVPGGSVGVVIVADQSVVADAGESVIWTVYVGGVAFPAGTLVHYAGVDVQTTAPSASAIAVDTRADFALPASVPITLIASSTYDGAEIGVNILITN